jgi:hypothetical protein
MRNSVDVARFAVLALVALGGCNTGPHTFSVQLQSALYRPMAPNAVVGKATVGSTVIENLPPYFMDITVYDSGSTTPTDHAVYVALGKKSVYYIGKIPLMYSSTPPPPGSAVSESRELTLTQDLFNTIITGVNGEVVIDRDAVVKTTYDSLVSIYSGILHSN